MAISVWWTTGLLYRIFTAFLEARNRQSISSVVHDGADKDRTTVQPDAPEFHKSDGSIDIASFFDKRFSGRALSKTFAPAMVNPTKALHFPTPSNHMAYKSILKLSLFALSFLPVSISIALDTVSAHKTPTIESRLIDCSASMIILPPGNGTGGLVEGLVVNRVNLKDAVYGLFDKSSHPAMAAVDDILNIGSHMDTVDNYRTSPIASPSVGPKGGFDKDTDDNSRNPTSASSVGPENGSQQDSDENSLASIAAISTAGPKKSAPTE